MVAIVKTVRTNYDYAFSQPLDQDNYTKIEFRDDTKGTNLPRQYIPAVKKVINDTRPRINCAYFK